MNIQALLKQAQQMQSNISKIEKEIENNIYTASSGGNLINVEVSGAQQVSKIEISEELFNLENKEEVQDLIMIAINSALIAAKNDKDSKMNTVTQGVKVPGII